MTLHPTSKNVLLVPESPPTQTTGGIHLVESNRWSSDNYVWRVFACGSAVPFDVQPGMRVVVDPTSLSQRDFTHDGQKFKTVPWKEVKMALGVSP